MHPSSACNARYSGGIVDLSRLDEATGRWSPVARLEVGPGDARYIGDGHLWLVLAEGGPIIVGPEGQVLTGRGELLDTPWLNLPTVIRFREPSPCVPGLGVTIRRHAAEAR